MTKLIMMMIMMMMIIIIIIIIIMRFNFGLVPLLLIPKMKV